MIIANGYIRYIIVDEEGGLDEETGYPIEVSQELSGYVACQFYATNLNYLSKENGEPVTKQVYTVLLEQSSGDILSGRVKLYRSDLTEVGEFPVISVTPLDAVCQYKMTL